MDHSRGMTSRRYRRAVTRRASTIFAVGPAPCKQDVAIFGHTSAEHSEAGALSFKRSALANAAGSAGCAFEAKIGKATTEAARTVRIAKEERDLTILDC